MIHLWEFGHGNSLELIAVQSREYDRLQFWSIGLVVEEEAAGY